MTLDFFYDVRCCNESNVGLDVRFPFQVRSKMRKKRFFWLPESAGVRAGLSSIFVGSGVT